MKHTKGPWFVRKTPAGNYMIHGKHNNKTALANVDVAEYGLSDEEFDANARLIAAAPELLEALNLLACEIDYRDKLGKASNNYHLVIAIYKNAIAKAEGTKE